IKAVENILPFIKEGLTYDKACENYGYDFKGVAEKKSKFLPPLTKEEQNELTNPVVKRTIAQLRKVVNGIIREHGQFDKIHVELTRDIKRTYKDRMNIQKGQKEFRSNKETAIASFKECFNEEPNGKNLLKFRLWQEQNERCAYSGEPIERNRIVEYGYVEIDHIIPFSRSFDNSLNNKVLVLAKENQNKRNRTPYEYITEEGKNWAEFEGVVSMMKLRKPKRDRLLKKNFNQDSEKEFKNRNSNDTSYLSRYIKNYIENKLEFKKNSKIQKVFTRNGQLTKLLRYSWGLQEKNRDNHLHHGEDALILAFSTQSEVQKLSTISSQREQFIYKKTQEKQEKAKFTTPYKNFKNDFEESVNKIFVSVAPRKKVTGAAHKETIYSKNSKSKGVFEVNGGVAENGEVKRVDIFQKDDKFHFIYMYPADFIAKDLKNTTIKGIEIDDTFDFLFSVYKDELVEIKQKDKEAVFGYFKFPLIDGRLAIQPNIKESQFNSTKHRYSTGSLEYIKKFQVSPLGEYREVFHEKRVETIYKLKKRKKNGMANSSNN
ncbi:MAG: type II CRISPR RNA-guided endonuclease Cas9, partial [Campylobacterales bacterium]|nr:type II CRISPR RNA-guided endonuclease Cas9 [Campylobacterales bacterium]